MNLTQEYISVIPNKWGDDRDIVIPMDATATMGMHEGRQGAWVDVRLFVAEEELEPKPGPSYDVWTAEPEQWQWRHDQRFTCDSDPDGKGARAAAHGYARYLRSTFHCAYVAVRPANSPPTLPIREPMTDEGRFKDFSASQLGL